jgi:hypothetical protein
MEIFSFYNVSIEPEYSTIRAKLNRNGGRMSRLSLCILMVVVVFCTVLRAADLTDSLKLGKPDIRSASRLAFGPDGILFIGDSRQAALFAIATEDIKPAPSAPKIDIKAVNTKIAALLGTMPDQILINDIKTNPLSHKLYMAVSRGRGPDGIPVILQVDGSGKISELSLDHVRYSMVGLPDAPDSKPDASVKGPEGLINPNPRVRTITDLAYVNGKVVVAGLSNEDFASDLHSIPFPFKIADKGTGVRIWHSSHGRYETAAPVDKFIPYTINKQQYILASYACTPLVKIPLKALNPGSKVEGTTIAELGSHNTPLEMFAYKKDGHDYILVAGSTRGVMKVAADNLGNYKAIMPPTVACQDSHGEQGQPGPRAPKECMGDIAGVPYETLSDLKGVWQFAKIDEGHAVVLADSKGAAPKLVDGNASQFTLDPTTTLDLTTIPLP